MIKLIYCVRSSIVLHLYTHTLTHTYIYTVPVNLIQFNDCDYRHCTHIAVHAYVLCVLLLIVNLVIYYAIKYAGRYSIQIPTYHNLDIHVLTHT